jgi:hypothetical protein
MFNRDASPTTAIRTPSSFDRRAAESTTDMKQGGFYRKQPATGAAPTYPPPTLPSTASRLSENDQKFLNFVQIWLVVWLQHIYNYMRRMRDNARLADELQRSNMRKMIDLDISQDSAISSGVSDTLSSVEHSPIDATAVVLMRSDDDGRRRRGVRRRLATRSLIDSRSDTIGRYDPLWMRRAGSCDDADLIHDMESSARLLVATIDETKYITAVFEAPRGGIESLIDDVLTEFRMWLDERGLLGIACEVHWSVPECVRNRLLESKMKDGIHLALRTNNRRVLDLKNRDMTTPLMIAESTTQENSYRETRLDCFQGIYRRCYASLLPYQHRDTVLVHAPYWQLPSSKSTVPVPNPRQFLFGADDRCLIRGSLVAVNLIALKVVAAEGA